MRRRLKGEPLASGYEKTPDFSVMCALATTPGCPAGRLPFLIGDQPVGWVSATGLPQQLGRNAGVGVRQRHRCDSDRSARAARASPGFVRRVDCSGWRGEAFDVRARPDGAGADADRSRRGAGFRHPGGRACMSTVWFVAPTGCICGLRGARWTSCWIPASWTISSPAACQPGLVLRKHW